MWLQDIELPEALVQAHREERLVLFVGAGVSHAPPSDLPLFNDLAVQVVERLGVPNAPSGRADEVLGELDGWGLNVHETVREIISESAEPNEAHRAVAALAMAGQSVRVVTTNYDRHLFSCLPDTTSVYAPPYPPAGGDFVGLVHAHGCVEQSPDRLVVTKTDFARAYLTPNSPTLRFLHGLFASQTVLFMGYSLEDTLMQYILLAAKEYADLYILTDKPDEPLWRTLGTNAVGYRSHYDLPAVLDEWARRAGATYDDHNRWVARIVADTTDRGDLARHDESYLSYVVSDAEFVRIFTEHARGPVWFRWVGTRPGTNLFAPAAELEPAEKELVRWFAKHHTDDDHTAAEVLRLIVENGFGINKSLWLSMAMAWNPRGGTNYETGNKLLLILADTAPAELDRPLMGLFKRCETPQDDDLFLELVDRVFRPKLEPPNPMGVFFEPEVLFQAVSNSPSDDWLRQSADREFWARRRHLAAELLGIVDGHLHRVCRIDAIAGKPDPFAGRAAIEAHDQNIGSRSTDFWVDAARDLYEILAVDLPETALGYLQSWAKSRWPVLNRLAIHGWTRRSDRSADEKIRWLLQQDEWVCDDRMYHETMRLIAETVAEASDTTIKALIDQITCGPDLLDRQIMYDMVGWVVKHAPSSSEAQTALAQVHTANPDLAMSDQPDFRRQVEITTRILPVQYIDGMEPQDLADRLRSDPAAATAHLLSIAAANTSLHIRSYEWSCARNTVVKATELSPAVGLALLDALASDPTAEPEASRSLATAVLMQLVRTAAVQQTTREHHARIRSVLAQVWEAGTSRWGLPPRPSPDHRWLSEAKNRWAGLVALLAIEAIASRRRTALESWNGLPTADRQLLKQIIAGDSHEAWLAQVVCASRLVFLHGVDRQWTVQHILPMLDPNGGEQHAVRCWDAYLHNGELSPELLEGLLAHFVAFAPHAYKCCPNAHQEYAHLAALLCLDTEEIDTGGPLRLLSGFFSLAPTTTRTRFIRSTRRLLHQQDPQTRSDQWRRWMYPYWQRRLRGVPQPLTSNEASALSDWATLLDDDYPTAVGLILQHPTPLQQDSLLPVELLRASRGTGPFVGLLNRHAEDTAQLIAHLLKHSDQAAAQSWDIAVTSVVPQLEAQTDHTAFRPVREQLLRLGWNYASRHQPTSPAVDNR